MAHIVESIIEGKSVFKLDQPFDTERKFISEDQKSKSDLKNGTLNFVNAFVFYDFEKYVENKETEKTIKEGLFLVLSDEPNSLLNRNAILHLEIDGHKYYEFKGVFSPKGTRCGLKYTTTIYYEISPTILKMLALSSKIKLSYEVPNEDKEERKYRSGFKNLDISGLNQYACVYLEDCYIEKYGSPEEKAALQKEKQAKKEEDEKRAKEDEKRAKEAAKEAEAKKLQEQAQRKSEWQAADPVEKLKILLKRHWKFVVLIILILCMFLS